VRKKHCTIRVITISEAAYMNQSSAADREACLRLDQTEYLLNDKRVTQTEHITQQHAQTVCVSVSGVSQQGRNHVLKLGVQFLGLGYFYPSTEKN